MGVLTTIKSNHKCHQTFINMSSKVFENQGVYEDIGNDTFINLVSREAEAAASLFLKGTRE